jgi:hypothetical protein
MNRIVRLTESDLARIVRRVISEHGLTGAALKSVLGTTSPKSTGVGKSAATQFIKALSGFFDDSEADALTAINRLKNKTDLGEFVSEITRVKGGTFCKYLNSEMSNADSEYEKIISKVESLGGPNCFDYSGWNRFMIAFKDTMKVNSTRY